MPERLASCSRVMGLTVLACVALLVSLIALASAVRFNLPDARDRSRHALTPSIKPISISVSAGRQSSRGRAAQAEQLPVLSIRPVQLDATWRLRTVRSYRGELLIIAKRRATSTDCYLLADSVAQITQAPAAAWLPFRSRLPRRIRHLPGPTSIDAVLLPDEPALNAIPSDTRILGAGISATSFAYLIRHNEGCYLVSGDTSPQSKGPAQWLDLSSLLTREQPLRELLGPDIHYATPESAKERRDIELREEDISHSRSLVQPCGALLAVYNWPRDLLLLVQGNTVYSVHPEASLAQFSEQHGGEARVPPVLATFKDNCAYFSLVAGGSFRRVLLVRLQWTSDLSAMRARPLGFIDLAAGDLDELSLAADESSLLVVHEEFSTPKTELFAVDVP